MLCITKFWTFLSCFYTHAAALIFSRCHSTKVRVKNSIQATSSSKPHEEFPVISCCVFHVWKGNWGIYLDPNLPKSSTVNFYKLLRFAWDAIFNAGRDSCAPAIVCEMQCDLSLPSHPPRKSGTAALPQSEAWRRHTHSQTEINKLMHRQLILATVNTDTIWS